MITIIMLVFTKTVKSMKIKCFVLVLLSLFSMVAFGQQKKIALLEPLVGEGSTGVSGMEKAMVRGELRKAIVNHTGYEAFTRADIDKLMSEQDFQRTGMVSDDEIKRIGVMSGADYICVSTLNKTNTEFYLEAYLVNVESAQISNPASQYGELVGGKLANMLPVCQALAQELLGTLSPAVSTITTTSSSRVSSNSNNEKSLAKEVKQKENLLNPEDRSKVGDLKTFPDGTKGVVFYMDQEGKGLAVSLNEIETVWDGNRRCVDIPSIINCDEDNHNFLYGEGKNNTQSIAQNLGANANAANWCIKQGEGWYMPSAGELYYLVTTAKKDSPVDLALQKYGSQLSGWYWASTEYSKTEAINVSSGGRVNTEEKKEEAKVRAIRAFTE